ncbi:MAG: aldehyde dehydrogenase family protein [Candidatus Velthaea sp.]
MPLVKDILQTMEYGPSPEANEHVTGWLAQHAGGFTHFIDGAFAAPHGGETLEIVDPAHATRLATVARATAADLDAAVAAARRAFASWSALPGHARARYLYAIARHIQKRERFLAVLESMDNGKPIRETRDIDIPLVARHFYHHAGWAELIETEFAGYGPVGVCGQIIPWNFPLLMLAWKIAPALAAGNTVVLKPASFTPLTALAFAEICQEVGLPAGVVNILLGDGALGSALAAHPDVDKIAFTGSTEVGRSIREVTAGSGKRLSLELGGKSPFIVFEDADLDAAVEGVVDAIWFNQGEVCCAGSRLLVQEGIAERFHAKLRRRMETLRVGDPLDKSTDIGAIVAPVQIERIRELVEQARREGGRVWTGPGALPDGGWFYPPTLITEVDPASTVAQIEIFGPVAVSLTFRTPDEALALANNTRYGLAASIWSENINRALDAAAKVKAGVVWINATNLFDAGAGFGGYKESGFGREGGREGMAGYLVADWERGRTPAPARAAFAPSAAPAPRGGTPANGAAVTRLPAIDRTAKLFIGGKQARPDSGSSFTVFDAAGSPLGQAGLGNRKDIRNAVEAAAKASSWSSVTAHNRAQILYYVGENLAAREAEFAARLTALTGHAPQAAAREVAAAIARSFWYAAWADKYDGAVHATKSRHVTLAIPEPWGVMGVVCPDEAPLLAFISLVMPALALGNRVVAVPSERYPLAATDLYQVLDTSDVPAGVISIVTGERDALAKVLALHDDVDAIWYAGSQAGSAMVEKACAGNIKASWVNDGRERDWHRAPEGQGRDYLQHATQVKNIWVPYGD